MKWKLVIMTDMGTMHAEIVDDIWLTGVYYNLFSGSSLYTPKGYSGRVMKMERVLDADIEED